MHRIAWRPILLVGLRLIITLLFVPAISVKLRHPAEWAHQFVMWGYPSWGAVFVSVVEVTGLIALWMPAMVPAAIVALIGTVTGATMTWLIHGPRATAAYPGAILVLLALLAGLEKAERTSRPESTKASVQ
ncbi:MAG TPA: DoxX family protein [Vicinamibacterales bacterium]|jgi:hypothetical protein